MTTTPRFLGMGSTGQASAARASRYCRAGAMARFPLANVFSTAMVPAIVEWPFASDANGQAYPAGTVGWYCKYTSQTADPTTTNNNNLMAVPDTLPAGYTLRKLRDHNLGLGATVGRKGSAAYTHGTAQSSGGGFSHNSASPSVWFIRSEQVLTSYLWLPECAAQQCFAFPISSGGSTISGALPTQWFPISAGFRYLRLDMLGTGAPTETYRISLVKNADNSNTQPGDTVVDSWTTPGNVAWDTGYLGPYESTLGTKCFFGLRVEVKIGAGAYGYTTRSVGIRAAPRCDIPFPWTTCGLDASGNPLISPGGIVTGAVPGY